MAGVAADRLQQRDRSGPGRVAAAGSFGEPSGTGFAPWRGSWRSGCARTRSASRGADGRTGACRRPTNCEVARRRRRRRPPRSVRHRPASPCTSSVYGLPASRRSRAAAAAERSASIRSSRLGPKACTTVEVGGPLTPPGVAGRGPQGCQASGGGRLDRASEWSRSWPLDPLWDGR